MEGTAFINVSSVLMGVQASEEWGEVSMHTLIGLESTIVNGSVRISVAWKEAPVI